MEPSRIVSTQATLSFPKKASSWRPHAIQGWYTCSMVHSSSETSKTKLLSSVNNSICRCLYLSLYVRMGRPGLVGCSNMRCFSTHAGRCATNGVEWVAGVECINIRWTCTHGGCYARDGVGGLSGLVVQSERKNHWTSETQKSLLTASRNTTWRHNRPKKRRHKRPKNWGTSSLPTESHLPHHHIIDFIHPNTSTNQF